MLRTFSKFDYVYKRKYIGRVKGVVLDWSGTVVDKYVIAPAAVFCEIFQEAGVPITMQEARKPMGSRKDLHIKAVLNDPGVRSRWIDRHGTIPTQDDVDRLFSRFVPLQEKSLAKHSTLLPGAKESVQTLQKNGIKVGVTTGFTKSMVDILVENTAKQGYHPDACIGGDEVKNGDRPKPFMLYEALERMNIRPIQSVVKVDDTVCGVEEGLEAGCWTVGVSRYSNYMDIDSFEHEASLSKQELEGRNEETKNILRKSGAHYVVDDLTYLPDIIEDINYKIVSGIMPTD